MRSGTLRIDVIALAVAQQFLDGALLFEDGDQILNLLWIRITDGFVEHSAESSMPELAYKIYDAFDAGEYDHGDGRDPITTRELARSSQPSARRSATLWGLVFVDAVVPPASRGLDPAPVRTFGPGLPRRRR